MAVKRLKRYSIQELHQIYKKDDLISKINNIEKLESSVCRSKFKIMVVHDSLAMADRIKGMIQEETVFDNIFSTNCLQEAKDLLGLMEIGLIISGYRMGKGEEDCYDLFKHVEKSNYNTSFLMASESLTDTEARNLKQAGVPLLDKSLNGDVIIDIIQCAYMKFLDREMEICLK